MDSSLVRHAQAGDEAAFERLALAIAERLHGVAWRILRDAALAEDATQQALLAIWRHLPSLRDPDRFEAWAYRTLVRACYEEAERTRRWRSAISPLAEHDPPAVDGLGPVEDRDVFERVFPHLTVEHRAVVVLHHYLGLTHDECGAVLGIPAGTVKSRLARALARMREELAADAPGPGRAPMSGGSVDPAATYQKALR